MGGGLYLHNSFKKYGIENFKKEILEFFDSREEVLKREAEIVTEELIADPLCMNIQIGGNGGWTKSTQRELSRRGLNARKEQIKWLSENDKEWVENKSIALSKSLKGHQGFLNKSHSKETRDQISKVNSIKQLGEKNSQYGKKFEHVCNDILQKNKKISHEELEIYLAEGWRMGRDKRYFANNFRKDRFES